MPGAATQEGVRGQCRHDFRRANSDHATLISSADTMLARSTVILSCLAAAPQRRPSVVASLQAAPQVEEHQRAAARLTAPGLQRRALLAATVGVAVQQWSGSRPADANVFDDLSFSRRKTNARFLAGTVELARERLQAAQALSTEQAIQVPGERFARHADNSADSFSRRRSTRLLWTAWTLRLQTCVSTASTGRCVTLRLTGVRPLLPPLTLPSGTTGLHFPHCCPQHHGRPCCALLNRQSDCGGDRQVLVGSHKVRCGCSCQL